MAVETGEYLKMLRRMIRAAGRRVADADEIELRELLSMREALDDAISDAVKGQRAIGRSWASIASATGTTRQAAWEKWRER